MFWVEMFNPVDMYVPVPLSLVDTYLCLWDKTTGSPSMGLSWDFDPTAILLKKWENHFILL